MIAAKQTIKTIAINEVKVFSIKYRYSYSDIFLLKHNIIYSVDKTFFVIRITDFNKNEQHAAVLLFPTPAPANKTQLFHT